MPWLWRLADEQQTPSHLQPRALPPGTRQNVLEGLAEAATSLECSHPSVSEESRCGCVCDACSLQRQALCVVRCMDCTWGTQ
eukprot:scaffold141163_cov21-Tisochrysis_lutea.AAC.1